MVLAFLVSPVEKVRAFSFPLKVLQSAEDKAPLLTAEAVGKLKVCTEPNEAIVKSVPDVPVANVCNELVKPFSEVIAFPERKLDNVLVVTYPSTSVVKIFVLLVVVPIP